MASLHHTIALKKEVMKSRCPRKKSLTIQFFVSWSRNRIAMAIENHQEKGKRWKSLRSGIPSNFSLA